MIKSILKALALHLLGRSVAKVLNRARNAEIISFDIFDTLIMRKCKAHDVFSLAQEKYNASHSTKIFTFREARVRAERTARRNSPHEEITLDEIYRELCAEYGSEIAGELKALELEAEFSVIYPNEELKEFYASHVKEGGRIIITSDMYLPGNVIAGMLRRCGYEGYESLYVSSEHRATKKSGGLFRIILRDKAITPSKILHVGDNIISDYFSPKRLGIDGFLLRS